MTHSSKKTIRIGTRGSLLAKWQAEYISTQLKALGFETEFVFIKTAGDRIQNRMLHEIGGKGLFVREIEEQLLDHKIDCAVHSLKDLPVQTPDGLELKAFIKRHPYGDLLLVSKKAQLPKSWQSGTYLEAHQLLELEHKLRIGSCSLRRSALMAKAYEHIEMIPLRGNVDTRLNKIALGELDGVILAEAAIFRLELGKEYHQFLLDPKWFVPSPCQGIIVVETRKDDPLTEGIHPLNCEDTQIAAQMERLVLKKLGADCTLPVGALAKKVSPHTWELSCMVGPHPSLPQLNQSANTYAQAQIEIHQPDDRLLLVEKILEELHQAAT